ncbi:Type IIS restriction enzyme Eco57I [subsurface metagenome]
MSRIPFRVVELIETFDRNAKALHSQQYNETQLRREFIDPFFEELGWDVTNKSGYAQAYKDVIHEDAIKVGGATKAPDYCFRIGGVRKFFLEAKKPSVNIKGDPHPAYQLRRYAWSAKLPLSILTDFEEFAAYDCQTRPKQTDKADTARIMYFTYKHYPENWNKIADVFSREAILKGSFDKFAVATKGKRGTTTVDVAFLTEIEKWRAELARIIALRNGDLSTHEINFAVQRTIDRIIFLRMCEDRGIEDYGQLLKISTGERTYPRLSEIFEKADQKYNSGLFHFQDETGRTEAPDKLTLNLVIDDEKLKWILYRLYYPQCPYEFSVLPPEILGNVYEQFLGSVIQVSPGRRAKVVPKPEVKKAGGVYYTPSYIVDYIVKNTVGKLLGDPSCHCEEDTDGGRRGNLKSLAPTPAVGVPEHPKRKPLTPRQVANLRILDPACGSGSFLLGAYTYLLNYYRDWYVDNGPQKHTKKIYQGKGGQWYLTITEKKRILLNNIFGVDIDSQAVEVTKLSLLLKVLEGEDAQTLENQYRFFHERALPDLANNIKCGNSLIGPDFFETVVIPSAREKSIKITAAKRPQKRLAPAPVAGGLHETTIPNDLFQKINPFDWHSEFPKIFSGKNPGFDAVIGNPPYIFTRELITKDEKAYYYQKYKCTQFKINTYFLFVENSFHLLNKSGALGYIVPNNWLSLEYSSEFRRFLLTKTFNISITNILHKVFQNASVDTCILIFGKTGENQVVVHEMENLNVKKISDCASDTFLNTTNCVIAYGADTTNKIKLCKRIATNGIQLNDLCEVRNGVQAYTVREGTPKQTKEMKDKRVYHSLTKLDGSWMKYVDGVDVKRYFIGWSKQFIKYGRNLSRPRKSYLFNGERLLVRQIPSKPPYCILACYVTENLINDNNSMIIRKHPEDEHNIKYIMGIVNSQLISFWFINTFGKLQRKVFPQFKIKELSQFPIHRINFDVPLDKTLHHKIVKLVDSMLDLHKKLAAAKIPDDKTRIQRQIATTDKQIDNLVYNLYGLTEEEIAIVEQNQ